jgi:hypothetical protein
MRKMALALLTLAVLIPPVAGGRQQARKTYEFTNGQWFDGKTFKRRVFYSSGGMLTDKKPRRVDETVDLGGGYVVPPFAEAHNHNVDGPYNIKENVRQYLREGVFYVKNPNNLRRLALQVKDGLNRPDSIDAVFSNGGLTATAGHPTRTYENLSKGPYKHLNLASFEGEAFFIINTAEDLESKWPQIAATQPDFIKTYLLYSEEFDKRRDDAEIRAKGLDPKVLALIVERAHRSGLRVSTHVETATDFHNAVAAGVDEINHLPGYMINSAEDVARFRISEQDARLAARKNIVVVTTTVVSRNFFGRDPEKLKVVQDNQVRNLRLLHESGVRLAVGSDNYVATSLSEAMNLYDLKVFDNLTLLKMWCETAADTIFPRRKIGRLKPGYEASFLVLSDNPLVNFESVKRITMRFKQGTPIVIAEN